MDEFRLNPRWQAVMQDYLAQTERELSLAVNSSMFNVVKVAGQQTPKADRAKFERELGVKSYQAQTYKRTNKKTGSVAGAARLNKKGKIRFSRVMQSGATLANLIINARLGRSGKKGLYGSAMKSATSKLISKRARGVGTLKAGWLNALRILGRTFGGPGTFLDGASSRVMGRSTAIPAKPGWSPQAQVSYNVNSFDQAHRGYIDERTKAALAIGFETEARNKMSHLAKKMAGTAEKAYAKSK